MEELRDKVYNWSMELVKKKETMLQGIFLLLSTWKKVLHILDII
ncbi:MAG: hypothetical protein ABH824_05190 [Nanoarchaeota archaeon]